MFSGYLGQSKCETEKYNVKKNETYENAFSFKREWLLLYTMQKLTKCILLLIITNIIECGRAQTNR